MEDKEREYVEKVCIYCQNNCDCVKDTIYVHEINCSVSIRCPKYKFIDNILE